MTHQDLGKAVLDKFFLGLSDIATIEGSTSMAGRDMSMIAVPIKETAQPAVKPNNKPDPKEAIGKD